MNPSQIIDSAKTELQKAETRFAEEAKKLRTGRAHPSMLDGIKVMAYGTPMPLIQVATVITPEPQLIQITPFDPGNIQAVADAIRNDQTLGLNPSDDGRVVRVPIPPLTQERRQAIVKQLSEKMEECFIACRQARHDALRDIKKAKDDKNIGEDEANRLEKQVDELMAKSKASVEATAKDKEKEILTI